MVKRGSCGHVWIPGALRQELGHTEAVAAQKIGVEAQKQQGWQLYI